MKLLTVLSNDFDKLKRLVIKSGNGKSDTKTAIEYGPFGTDSNPVKGTRVLHNRTEMDGVDAIVGCQNTDRKSGPGEHRLFCTDSTGAFKFNVWLRADGTLLMGDSSIPAEFTNFAVLYNELKADLDAFKQSHNNLVSAFNQHVHAAPGGSTSAPTAVPLIIPVQPNSTDFSNIKNEKIKTN